MEIFCAPSCLPQHQKAEDGHPAQPLIGGEGERRPKLARVKYPHTALVPSNRRRNSPSRANTANQA